MPVKKKQFPGDPHTYLMSPIDSKKYNAICQGVFLENGVEYRCHFVQRSDNLKNQISKGIIHDCHDFKEVPKQKNDRKIDIYLEKPKKTSFEDYNSESLTEQIAIFIAKSNLSMKVGTSDDMYNLLKYAFICGCLKGNPQMLQDSADKFVKTYRQDYMTNIMKNVAQKIDDSNLLMYNRQHMEYCTVALDEGSTKKRKMLDFCLENPYYLGKSYPAFTCTMNGIKAKDYVISITKGLVYLESKNINVGVAIMDNSSAQMKAFRHDYNNNIRAKAKSIMIKKILTISCACHKVHNTFKTTIERNNKLGTISDYIHNLFNEARSIAKEIGATCPKHNNTRWVDDFYILSFLRQHKDKINNEYIDTEEFDDYFEICSIFKALIDIFENPKNALSIVYPKCLEAAYALQEFCSRGNNIARPFIERINDYILNGKNAGQYALAYLLSPSGHSTATSILKGSFEYPDPHKSSYRKKFSTKHGMDFDSYEEIISELSNQALDDLLDEDDAEPTQVEKEFNKPIEEILEDFDESDSEEPLQKAQEESKEKNNLKQNEAEKPNLIDVSLLINHAFNYFEEALKILGLNKVEESVTKKLFTEWIELDVSPFTAIEDYENHHTYNYSIIRLYNNDWKYICDVGLRLRACPCSEASCERTISTQRLLYTTQRLRSNESTIDARLKIIKG